MPYLIGVDIGGTFTDFALFQDETAEMAIYKQLTTPHQPASAVLNGITKLLNDNGVSISNVNTVVHGTTLVTNTIIERTGTTTGMLVTEGFMDIPDMRLELRYDMFNLHQKFPKPVVPRARRSEIHERINYEGKIQIPLDLNIAKRRIQNLVDEHEIEALAVCFLHSYINSEHEDAIKGLCTSEFPDLYVSLSSEVFPQMREYERWTTTMVNAYTQPMFNRYLEQLEIGLIKLGFCGKFFMMSSNGGTVTSSLARRLPVRMMESGPAAGVLMSAHHGHKLGLSDLLSFDMGGTTAKGALVRSFSPLKKYEIEVARENEFKSGSGLTIKIPVIDMIEIGAGGGSIAKVDKRGLLQVGPSSAGAEPGPACYGVGGRNATLTDANLVLGYLNPDFFLGGELSLNYSAAETAIMNDVARPLGLSLTRAAWGIHEIIDEDIARAFRIHASERGFDYRNCSMVAFGGSGPIHAAGVARKLGIPRVVFPLAAGVMSAFGLLISPLSFEVLRSNLVFVDDLETDWVTRYLRPMVGEATSQLKGSGIKDEQIRIKIRLDMRYHGQGYEIEVILPVKCNPNLEGVSKLRNRLKELFEAKYAEIFSDLRMKEPLEIINWKVEAIGPRTLASRGYKVRGNLSDTALAMTSKSPVPRGNRQAYFSESEDYLTTAIYHRIDLSPGDRISGPALIEERESTCLISSQDVAQVDENYNVIVELG